MTDDGSTAGSLRGGWEVKAQVLIKERLCLVDVAIGCFLGAGRRRLCIDYQGLEVLGWCGCVGGHEPEAGVLEEVRPEVVAAENRGAVVTTTYEAAPHNHVVPSIEARGGEVIIDIMHLEAIEGVKVVLGPFPSIAHGVVMSRRRWGHGVHRTLRGVGQVGVRRTWPQCGKGLAASPEGAVPHGLLASLRHVGAGVPDEVVLRLGDDAVRRGALQVVLLRLPSAVGPCLMVVDIHWPIPLHVLLFEDSAQSELHRALRAIGHPEEGPLHVPEAAPSPAILRPIALRPVAAGRNKLPKLAIGDEVLAGFEVWHLDSTMTVLIVPSVGRVVARLPQLDAAPGDRHELVLREVDALFGMRGRRTRGRGMRLGPAWRQLHDADWHLAEKH
mmetsp:Transcript_28183/g.70808  ORF Transcript_28183/g.70808 Transcript_28183/m.70808 type:complete len:386 (-) Transcript_28183:970-2127(-)